MQKRVAPPTPRGAPGQASISVRSYVGPLAVLAVLLGGCGDGRGHTHSGVADLVPLLIPFQYLGLAITADAVNVHNRHRGSHAAGAPGGTESGQDFDVYVGGPTPPELRSALDATPSRLGAINGAAVLEGIDRRDFHACRLNRTPPGWNHALVTFKPDGSVSRVTIDWSVWMSRSASACFRSEIGRISVPPFQGPATTLGVWFFTF